MNKLHTFVILLLIVTIGCKDDSMNQHSDLSEKPPFDSFWFSTRFNLPSDSPTSIQDLSFFSLYAESQGIPTADQYRYESPNTTEEIVVSTNGDIISFSSTGILNLSGDHPAPTFTGDVALWSSNCTYELLCEIDKSAKTVTKATLHIFSETFNSSYDLTSIMYFTEGEKLPSSNAPEWAFGNSLESAENVSRNHSIGMQFLFVVDDVLGTSYKN